MGLVDSSNREPKAALRAGGRRDFEVTRRHYKHIAEIVTYEDLLRRPKSILNQLKTGI